MKKLLLLPTIIFPYVVCLFLGYMLIPNDITDTMYKVFAVFLIIVLAISFVCNLIYIFIVKDKSPYELLKTALLVKIIHIPTYILIFILGLIMGMMFFMTFPLIIFLVLVDLLTLWLSGIISIHSISKVLKETKSCSKPVLVFAIICQFIFCADVISLFVVKSLTKNKYS